jgi:hypothetical protein
MESAKTPLQIRLTPEVLTKLDRYRQQFPFAPSRADVALKALDDWLDRQEQAPVDVPASEVPTPSIGFPGENAKFCTVESPPCSQ